MADSLGRYRLAPPRPERLRAFGAPSRRWELDPRPPVYQTGALPLCYVGGVEPRGIEPRFQDCRSCVFPLDDDPAVRRQGIEPWASPASGERSSSELAARWSGVSELNGSQELVGLPQGRFANPGWCSQGELNSRPWSESPVSCPLDHESVGDPRGS